MILIYIINDDICVLLLMMMMMILKVMIIYVCNINVDVWYYWWKKLCVIDVDIVMY